MLLREIIFSVSFVVILSSIKKVFSEESERCGPQGVGLCKHICSCPLALEMLSRGEVPNLPICSFENEKYPVVCCYRREILNKIRQPSQNSEVSISQIMCKENYDTICKSKLLAASYADCLGEEPENTFGIAAVGGQLVQSKELPFMGLVGYQVRNSIEWACGCSLISKRYVLTAAHCTTHPTYGFARVVRLGELDYSTKDEVAEPKDFKILKHINHPNYQSKYVYNDIALFFLDEIVDFTNFIRPICLPTAESYRNVTTVYGAGWGRTDFVGPLSSALLKVNLNYLRIDQCSRTVDRTVMPQGLDKKSMICAGVLEGGRDTCTGDSGGPLYLPPTEDLNTCFLYTQIGITSFGKNCALKGIPGVYTNVHYYVPWIESIVWPENRSESQSVWRK